MHQVALLLLVGALTSGSLGYIRLMFVTLGAPALLFGFFSRALVDRTKC